MFMYFCLDIFWPMDCGLIVFIFSWVSASARSKTSCKNSEPHHMSQPSCFRFLTLDLTGMRRHLRNVFSRVKLKSDFIPVVIWIEFETSCSVLDFLGDSDCNCDSDSHIWFDFWPLASAHSFSPAGCVGRGSKSEVEVAEARGCSANDGATSIPKGHSSKIISKGGFCETSAKGCRSPTDCLPKNTTKGGTGCLRGTTAKGCRGRADCLPKNTTKGGTGCLRGTTAKGCTGRKGQGKGCLPETTAEDDATASDSKISTWGWGPSSRECSASSIGKCTGREGSCWETYLRDQTSNSLQHQLIRWVRNGDWGGLGRKFQAFYEKWRRRLAPTVRRKGRWWPERGKVFALWRWRSRWRWNHQKKDGHHQPQPIQVKQELDDEAQVVAVDPSIERSMMIGLWNRVKLEQEKDEMRRGRSYGSLSRN